METTCLGDLYDQLNYIVECVDLKHCTEYDRNLQLFNRLNLGGFYEFLKAVANTLKLNYFSTSRPTNLEYDSTTRQLCKSVKNMFSNKRRRLRVASSGSSASGMCLGAGATSSYPSSQLSADGSVATSSAGDSTSMDKVKFTPPNVDFFVTDRKLVVVSPFLGANLRVTTIPIGKEFSAMPPQTEIIKSLGMIKNTNSKSFLVVTENKSEVTTISINECFGFGFEVFVGFLDKAVCFLKINVIKEVELYNTNINYSGTGCYNVTGYLYLDEVPLWSKYSPNRELVLLTTKNSVYLLEKSGFHVEYDKLCQFKSGTLMFADFLNDFEILVLENNCLLTVYKKQNLKYSVYIRYNLTSLMTRMSTVDRIFSSSVNNGPSSGVNTRVTASNARPYNNFGLYSKKHLNTSVKRVGKMVKDQDGNAYILVKNMELIKLTWNETLVPYSNTVTLHTPDNLIGNDNQNRLINDISIQNNLIVVTFKGSGLVHLYSLTSLKELNTLKPPRENYLPKFLKSYSSNDCCYLLVLWSHRTNYYNTLEVDNDSVGMSQENAGHSTMESENVVESNVTNKGYEGDLENKDILRTYKIKSVLTKSQKRSNVSYSGYSMGTGTYPTGYNVDYSGYRRSEGFISGSGYNEEYREWPARKLPVLSALRPKIRSRSNIRCNDFSKFDDSFANRRHLLGRSLGDRGVVHENIYSIEEFIRNRRK